LARRERRGGTRAVARQGKKGVASPAGKKSIKILLKEYYIVKYNLLLNLR
jgi:hypothetical protein